MNNQLFTTTAQESPAAEPEIKTKPLTSRLRKSKNFWKVDRELDNYIDSNKLIKTGPKSLLKKLLLLRSQEDSNEVKVTVAGLSTLMDVDRKTIRDWLKQLQDKQFIFSQGDVWDPHCNFPKKKFVFAHTFPGFDSGAVFIQRGAKAKYKQRQARKAMTQPAVKGRICKRRTAQNTCPVSPRFLDCSTHFVRGTRNKKREEETIVSSSPTPSLFLISERSTELRCAKPVSGSNRIKKQSEPKTVLDCSSELRSLLTTMLTQAGCKGQIRRVSNFIDECARQNGSLRTWEDIKELADDLNYAIGMYYTPGKRNVLVSLFPFLREYISIFNSRANCRSSDYRPWNRHHEAEMFIEEFFQRYPFCLPDLETGRETGVNR